MNTSPDMPSSRPMTLRQQLAEILPGRPYPDYNMGLLPDEEGYDEVQLYQNVMADEKQDEAISKLEALCQEIAREAVLSFQKLDNVGKILYLTDIANQTIGEVHGLAEEAERLAAELTSLDTTAAGNDLPSYDPKADIVATLRRKGQLTQKPPQPLADMQSSTSPKADNNQVDNSEETL